MKVVAEIKQESKYGYYTLAESARAYAAPTLDEPELSPQSGSLTLDLPQILPGDRFASATVKVSGRAFAGKLKDLAGAAVRESPETVDEDGNWGGTPGSQRGFILDFGGMRSILRLLRSHTTLRYALVLPWLGTDFALASLFPAQKNAVPARIPDPDGYPQVSLRGTETQKLYVQVYGNLSLDQFLETCVVETLVFPANLRAGVADKPPFWTHPGPLQGDTDMPGLPEALTALAAELTAPLVPRLTLQSDAPGVLSVPGGFAFLRAEKSAAASWAGSASTTAGLRAGVTGTLPMHFPDPKDGKIWELRSLKLRAAAALAPWILEAATPDPEASQAAIRMDGRLSAAQGFSAARAVELHGVGLFLSAAKGAEASIELARDDGGRPAAGPAMASRMLSVSGPAAWYEALFEKPLMLDPGIWWIVAKTKSGAALWTAAPAPAEASAPGAAALYAEDGTAWQPYPRMLPVPGNPAATAYPAAGLRLFRTPRAEENQARVVVSHAYGSSIVEMALPVSGEAVDVEWLWPAAARPALAPAADGHSLELSVRALSSGDLNIAAATVFFAWKGA